MSDTKKVELSCGCGREFEEEEKFQQHIQNCAVYKAGIIADEIDNNKAESDIKKQTEAEKLLEQPEQPGIISQFAAPTETKRPFAGTDFNAFRLSDNYNPQTITLYTEVPIRKPKRFEFFRTKEDSEGTWKWAAKMLEMEEGMDKILYLVAPEMWDSMSEDLRQIELHAAINTDGTIFLINVTLVDRSGKQNHWSESMLKILEMAKTEWVQAKSSKALAAYMPVVPISNLGEPRWPVEITTRDRVTIPLSMDALLRIAFPEDRIIKDTNHPIIKKITGVTGGQIGD